MNNTEVIKVEKSEVDGIEFYVSDDGNYTGMSQSGLAFLCGVGESAIRGIVNKLGSQHSLPESLESLTSKEFWTRTESKNNVEVVPSEVCAGIIEYYAFESKAKNNKALFSYRKFAKKGIDSWIKEITGFNDLSKLNSTELLKTVQEVLSEVKELRKESKEYNTIRGKTTTIFPNLDKMLVDISNEENLLPGEDLQSLTATEWLRDIKGVTLSKSRKHKFALLLSETYKNMTGKNPQTTVRENINGSKNNGVAVYRPSEWCVLELTFNKLFDRI